MKMSKKAQAVTLGRAPNLILLLGLTAMIAGATALATSSFQSTLTANTAEYNATTNGLTGILNFTTQMPTVGTVLGVALIIVAVVGAFAFFLRGQQGSF